MGLEIKKVLKKFVAIFLKRREDKLSEADTVQRIIMFFEEVLGYDRLEEITCEGPIKDKFVDITVKIEGVPKLLVEAKAAEIELKRKHEYQAQDYAFHAPAEWVVLTNGLKWNLYHLTFSSEGVEPALAFTIDLSEPEQFNRAAEQLVVLHRKSVSKGQLDEFWKQRTALCPKSIAHVLFAEDMLMAIRRAIRRSEKILIDSVEDLAFAIQEMFSVETREKIGEVKIRRKPKRKTDVIAKPDVSCDPPA